MKKLLILFIVLAVVLGACGTAVQTYAEDETTMTTEFDATTEVEERVTQPFVPAQGEINGMVWQTINLHDDPQLRTWLGEEWEREQSRWRVEHQWTVPQPMGDNYVVFQVEDYPRFDIVMRNETTGEITTLLARYCVEEHENLEHCWECRIRPLLHSVLDERYILFSWGVIEVLFGYYIFDIQTMQEHPLEVLECDSEAELWPFARRGDVLFWCPGDYAGSFSALYSTHVEDVPNLIFTDMLADIDHEPLQWARWWHLCADERLYILVCSAGLHVFDLEEQTAFQLDKHDLSIEMGSAHNPEDASDWSHAYLQRVLLRDNTIYWFSSFTNENLINMNIAVQIILP
ncbi:MAG: hypothetical protein FWD06_05910 [Oscillospiraceae bacterium]|nr:hypothetical protein [Oscillospiraceae bacterium]